MIYDHTERIYPDPSPTWLSPGDRGDYTKLFRRFRLPESCICSSSIQAQASPSTRMQTLTYRQMEAIFNRLVKEREPYYQHTCEGDDDMPAHAKATLSGTSLTIPITNGRLTLGIWQGI